MWLDGSYYLVTHRMGALRKEAEQSTVGLCLTARLYHLQTSLELTDKRLLWPYLNKGVVEKVMVCSEYCDRHTLMELMAMEMALSCSDSYGNHLLI